MISGRTGARLLPLAEPRSTGAGGGEEPAHLRKSMRTGAQCFFLANLDVEFFWRASRAEKESDMNPHFWTF